AHRAPAPPRQRRGDRARRGHRAAGPDHGTAGEGAGLVRVSTHVLDAVPGRCYVHQRLLARGVTDDDGRCRLTEDATGLGTHRLVFATGQWFAEQDPEAFYPEGVLTFHRAAPRDPRNSA